MVVEQATVQVCSAGLRETPNTLRVRSGVSPAASPMWRRACHRDGSFMISIESLTVRYGRFTAVDDVSFTARSGRVTGFLGPNGAGKSTTMRVMVGLTSATTGQALIDGRPFADLPNP